MSDLADDMVDVGTPVSTEDWWEALKKLSDGLRRSFTELGNRQPQLFSVEVEVAFTAGSATTVTHGLGVVPNRFSVTDIDDAAILYRTGTWTAQGATLTASGGTGGTARVRFWRAA